MSADASTQVDPLLDRFDRLTRLLELALAPQLDAARTSIREDPTDAAILAAGKGGWKPAAKVIREVEVKTGKKKSSVKEHISGLTERGFLEKQGAGKATKYRTPEVV